MKDVIKVNTDNMYEFCRALSDFEDSLDGFSRDLKDLTRSLGDSMVYCSRYELVSDEVKKSAVKIDGKLQSIHAAASDLRSRADFLEDFERGVDFPAGARRIDEI